MHKYLNKSVSWQHNKCARVCMHVDLKRLLPSMSPDPAEMQRAIEVQLIRCAVGTMTKGVQPQEQRASANQEWVFILVYVQYYDVV